MQPNENVQLQPYFLQGQESSSHLEALFSWNGRDIKPQESPEFAFTNHALDQATYHVKPYFFQGKREKNPAFVVQKTGIKRRSDTGCEPEVKRTSVVTEDLLIKYIREGGEIPNHVTDYALELTELYIKNEEGLSEEQICSLLQICSNVQSLSLPKNVTDNSLNALTQLPNLRELDLSYCEDITDVGCSIVSNLNLTYLKLECCNKVTEDGFKMIERLHNITSLHLIMCRYVTDEVIETFSQLQNMTHLTIKVCGISDRALRIIGQFPNLEELNLSDCKEITDKGCSYLSSLTKLIYLDLSFCNKITDQGILAISLIKTLHYLSLKACHLITDLCIQYIDNLPNLAILNINQCNISYEAFNYLTMRLQL